MKSVTRQALEKLKFENGKFVLHEVATPKLRLKLSKDPHWSSGADDSYSTIDLGAAARFRRLSSGTTEKIFKRAFQEHYSQWLPPLPPELDPHQVSGIEWAFARKRSYLAHAPGAGKTAQVIILAGIAQGPGQNVFIVPPTLTKHWEREILKVTDWWKDNPGDFPTIGIVGGSDKQDRVAWRAEFVIVPDSMLCREWVYTRLSKMKKRVIAVDEASRMKEAFSARSLAFYGGKDGDKNYPGLFQDARHVVLLDGSPMPNRSMELWAPVYALHPQAIDCMGQNEFGYRYCGARPNARGQWEFLFSSNEAELKQKLQADFMHVVTEDELSHPERRRSLLFMNEDVRSVEHRTWERRHLVNLRLDTISEDTSQGELAHFRKELGLRKVPWVSRYVGDRLKEKNESILLFAWHRDVVSQLAMNLSKWKPGIIIGGVNAGTREKEFERFQSGRSRLLILNILAGGRGHNLQKADRAIFAEYSWTDETNKQAEKRASRKGSDKKYIRCEYVVCPGSMDERILNSVFTKQKRVKKVIG